MLVYGDNSITVDARERCRQIHEYALKLKAAGARNETRSNSYRHLLILIGQFEQGIQDALAASRETELIDAAASATHMAATLFVSDYLNANHALDRTLDKLINTFRELPLPDGLLLKLKIPEGFAFYALFPEQYIKATQNWLIANRQTNNHPIIVAGIRSIGTTLSAVVSATLEFHGRSFLRLSVRPSGHPFRRHVELRQSFDPCDMSAIVVDEGPGISGSSMAATAEALVSAGVSRSRVSFFSGHGGLPQRQMDDRIHQWWHNTARYVATLNDLRWNSQLLEECLVRASERFMVDGNAFTRIENVSGGNWRSVVFPGEDEWPPVCASFERPKYRVVCEDGSSILWKFGGLAPSEHSIESAAELDFKRLSALAENDTELPLEVLHGFVARRWIDGSPICASEVDDDLLFEVARYINRAARPPRDEAGQHASAQRLADVVCCNVKELFGDWQSEKLTVLVAAGLKIPELKLPQSSGAHVAPVEWLRTCDGRVVNLDCTGHDTDHTCVGLQTVLWDYAGIVIEWSLSEQDAAKLKAFIPALDPVSKEMINFTRIAYAAFRAGQCVLSSSEANPNEFGRLKNAIESYRKEILRHLEQV